MADGAAGRRLSVVFRVSLEVTAVPRHCVLLALALRIFKDLLTVGAPARQGVVDDMCNTFHLIAKLYKSANFDKSWIFGACAVTSLRSLKIRIICVKVTF